MTAGASDPAANIPSRVQFVLSEKTIDKNKAPTSPTPVTFFSPQSSEGQAIPRRNVAISLRLWNAHPSPLSHPHFSFWLLPHLPAEGGKNKGIVHSGNCRPLCRLSVLALLKFRVVCSGSDKSSIRFLFRASKAHAELDSSTAPFTALGLGEALPPDDLLPRLSSA